MITSFFFPSVSRVKRGVINSTYFLPLPLLYRTMGIRAEKEARVPLVAHDSFPSNPNPTHFRTSRRANCDSAPLTNSVKFCWQVGEVMAGADHRSWPGIMLPAVLVRLCLAAKLRGRDFSQLVCLGP